MSGGIASLHDGNFTFKLFFLTVGLRTRTRVEAALKLDADPTLDGVGPPANQGRAVDLRHCPNKPVLGPHFCVRSSSIHDGVQDGTYSEDSSVSYFTAQYPPCLPSAASEESTQCGLRSGGGRTAAEWPFLAASAALSGTTT